MAMKPVFKFLIATGVCVAANASYANFNWSANPYLGLEYKLSYTQGKADWKRLLPTNKPNNNGTLFAGLKFHDCLAAELGYTQSNKRTKASDVSGFTMFGGVEGAGSKQQVKLGYRSWHLDLNGQYPAGDSFAFLGTVGLATTKPKLEITNLGSTAGATNNSSITTISAKSKMVPRLGVGVQYTQGMFGVRSRLMWEGTSRLRFNTGSYNGGNNGSASDKPFKSSYAWTLGAFVRW